jgi:hypothetical protein
MMMTILNTIVVPSRDPAFFERVALGEQCWHHIRIHRSKLPQIEYIAIYRTAPISAITHVAPIASIEPWHGSEKYVLHFASPLREIGPIHAMPMGRVKAPQNARYANYDTILQATSLDDIFDAPAPADLVATAVSINALMTPRTSLGSIVPHGVEIHGVDPRDDDDYAEAGATDGLLMA